MLTVTDSAKEHLKKFVGGHTEYRGIRVEVKGTGCSGLTYVVEPAVGPDSDDITVAHDGLNIYIDPCSAPYIQDLEIDFVKRGFDSKLEFSNPQEKSRCGCGNSFSV
jgi:iron-sulfur cluster assembly accessory protein